MHSRVLRLDQPDRQCRLLRLLVHGARPQALAQRQPTRFLSRALVVGAVDERLTFEWACVGGGHSWFPKIYFIMLVPRQVTFCLIKKVLEFYVKKQVIK